MKGIWYDEKAKRRAPVISLSKLIYKADHQPESLTKEEETKLQEMLDRKLSHDNRCKRKS